MLLFDPNLLRFSTQHDPILDPKLAPINPSFALRFPITFPTRFPTLFWTDFGPQIDFKIDQKSIRNIFQKQATNKPYFSFIFDQISKTISCSSKMVDFQKSFQNIMFFACFFDINSCKPKQTRDMQRIEKSSKTISKNQWFFYWNSAYFRSLLASISKSEIWTSWGRSWARFWPRFPTMLGSKTTSERHQKIITKKGANISPTWAPTWPQEASQNGLMNRRRGGAAVQDSPLDRSYA